MIGVNMELSKSTVKRSLSGKLLKSFMITNLFTLMITMSAFLAYDYSVTKKEYLQQYDLIKSSVSDQSIRSLLDNDTSYLINSYKEIAGYEAISEIALFKEDGKPFFSSPQTLDLSYQDYIKSNASDSFYSRSLYQDSVKIGTFVIKPNQNFFYKHVYAASMLGLFIVLFLLMAIFFLAKRLSRNITSPIKSLTEAVYKIATEKNFKLRVTKIDDDELGVFTDSFNAMLNEIQNFEDAHALQLELSEDSYRKVKFLLDATESTKKRLEEEAIQRLMATNNLKKIRNHLDDIINSMPSALICVDKNYCVKEWNVAAVRLTGIPVDEARHLELNKVLPMISEYVDDLKASVGSQEVKQIEKVKMFIDEKEHFYNILIYPLTQNENPGAVIRLDDVTTHVRMENMMVQTEKMMSVGGLAAGMAHEINNPLGGVLQSTQNLIRRIDPKLPKNISEAHSLGIEVQLVYDYLEKRGIIKFIEGIQDSGERAAKIVKNMLQFSRKNDDVFFNNADVNQILDRSISLAANDYDMAKSYDFRKIAMHKHYEEGMPFVPCVSSEVEQVILNLLRNAAQALHEQVENTAPCITVTTSCDKDFVHIFLTDNGPGMDAKHLGRIFEPFFTTKEVGVGTGLGLSVSFFIIESKHQGKMFVQSEVGKGTTFTISLPLIHVEKKSHG